MQESDQIAAERAGDASAAAPGAGHDTLEFLLRRMRLKKDFPALSESIQRINEIARSESERVDAVSSAILQDFSLTNKILRLVNSSYYRGAGMEPVSTMSRAIMVLGFEAVRTLAVSLTLFEHMADKARATQLREEFVRASLRASIARSMVGGDGPLGEEAHLAGMFHRLGRMLALYYFPEEFDEIERQSQAGVVTEEVAARKVLGLDLQSLGAAIAASWGFPPMLQRCMTVLDPSAPLPATANHEAHLSVVANFSAELVDLIERSDGAKLQGGIDALARRYGKSLEVTGPAVRARIDVAAGRLRELARVLGLDLAKMPLGRRVLAHAPQAHAPGTDGGEPRGAHSAPGELPVAGLEARAAQDAAGTLRDGAGVGGTGGPASADTPDDAPRRQEILANGLVDLSRTLAEQSALNDVVRMAIETLYRGMALQRVLFALRDARTNTLVGRLGFGAGMPELARNFRIPLDATGDLFAVTAIKGADLLIHDSTADNISSRIPAWYRESFGAGSFILLPLALRSSPVGLIYADQPGPNQISIGEQELSLVRAIRNQVVLAFRQARSG